MRFGVCAGIDSAADVVAAGFDYIELGVFGVLRPEEPHLEIVPALLSALQKAGTHAETYNGLLPGDLKVIGSEIDPKRQEHYLEEAFARAAILGGEIAVFGSGVARMIPPEYSRERAHEEMLDFLKRCGPIAARHGITVVIEPLYRGECNFINSVAEAQRLVAETGHPAIQVLSDLYHVTQGGQSFEETKEAASVLRHVHVCGSENRRAPCLDDIPFLLPYFRALKEVEYTGRISIEGGWTDLKAQSAEAYETLQRAWANA